MVADMGAYERISSSQAPDWKALVGLADLWRNLLKVSPSGEVHAQPLRAALLSLLAHCPSLNSSDCSGQVWVGLRVERINCLLTHLRKIKRDGEGALGKAAAKLSRQEFQQLQAGLQLLTLKDEESLEKPSSAQPDLGKSGPGKSRDLEKTPRKLKKRDSDDVSLNSFGLPRMFDSPPASKKQRGEPSSSSKDPGVGLEKPSSSLALVPFQPDLVSRRRAGSRVPAKQENLSELLGYSAPAEENKKKKRKKKKRKLLGKAEAAEAEGAEPKAYLLGRTEVGEKMRLIIEVSQSRCPAFSGIIDEIKATLEKEHLTKEEARDLREHLCSQHGC
ncbi:unnamed protein product [Symbiodinium sp. CCMP2592]|nr:unnamed protein product [Symbiodinium sp. CCMP2592]